MNIVLFFVLFALVLIGGGILISNLSNDEDASVGSGGTKEVNKDEKVK